MKTLNKLFATGAMVFLLMLMAPHKSMAQDGGYVSDQEFYDELQQYGTWVQDDQYGDVWVPDVDGDFRPYATNGYWVQTDYGTTWVSDYPWGWATFHYGRWRYDDYYGWEWIPGHEWAPAWVSWRQGGGYYGWAPMGPGISLTLSLGGIGLNINNDYWVYAPQRYITSRYINRYYAPRTQISIIIRKTTYIRNTYVYNKRTYITGPRPVDIQRITRRKVTVYKINDAPKPGGVRIGVNVINIYRPAIRKSPDARPVRVVSATAYRNEHPNEGIGKKGAIGYNHGNAGKLASIARSANPNSNIVKVNPKKEKPNGPNKPNEPANNNPAAPKGDKDHHKNTPAPQPEQGGGNQAQPAGNKPAGPQGNAPAKGGKGHHKNEPVTQPEQGSQPQPAVNKPTEPQGNTPAQPEPNGKPEKHGHKAPAVITPAPNNTDQAKKDEQQQQQAKDLALQQKQQAAELKRQQQQQEQQAKAAAQQQRQEAQQQRLQQQQQEQQAKAAAQQQRQQAQQQREQQQQQAQQEKAAAQQQRQEAQQQREQQQQQAQQARAAAQQQRQEAQQQKLQQQQAQQAARQQAQQQKLQQQQQAREARQQAQEQKKQQEEQQKNPPRN